MIEGIIAQFIREVGCIILVAALACAAACGVIAYQAYGAGYKKGYNAGVADSLVLEGVR